MSTSYADTRDLVLAGTTVLHLASWEWSRVRGWTFQLGEDLKVPVLVWSASSGLMEIDAQRREVEVDAALDDPIGAIEYLAGTVEGGVLLLEDLKFTGGSTRPLKVVVTVEGKVARAAYAAEWKFDTQLL